MIYFPITFIVHIQKSNGGQWGGGGHGVNGVGWGQAPIVTPLGFSRRGP